MRAGVGRLLRVLASQEGGTFHRPTLSPYAIVWLPIYDLFIADVFCVGELKLARATALQAAYRKSEAANGRANAPSAEQIRNLGLLDKEENVRPGLAIVKEPGDRWKV
ncbi:hypothetical protein MMC10_006310 [Thelotrema lepadinum]|nr:hypothetical protein [Thelotrema lepadinum]